VFLSSCYKPAGEPLAGCSGRLCPVVIGILMNNYGFAYDISNSELVSEKAHAGTAMVREQHRKVSGMIAMGLTGRIPMFSCCLERIIGVTYFTIAELMYMKAMGPNGRIAAITGPEFRESVYIDINLGATGNCRKYDPAVYIWRQGATTNHSRCKPRVVDLI